MTNVVCCEHNLCPDRPKHWLGRFKERPWRCAQCGRWWITEWTSSYADESFLAWKNVKGPECEDEV